MSAIGADPVLAQLAERMASLDDNCLRGLEEGLNAAAGGDNTIAAVPCTTPIDAVSDDPVVQGLADVFNRMLGRAQPSVESYGTLRKNLQAALGDDSCLEELRARMISL